MAINIVVAEFWHARLALCLSLSAEWKRFTLEFPTKFISVSCFVSVLVGERPMDLMSQAKPMPIPARF